MNSSALSSPSALPSMGSSSEKVPAADSRHRAAELHARNEALRALIARCHLDASYTYRSAALFEEKVSYLAHHCAHVLDFGKSSRHLFDLFRADQITTTDINLFDGYPDIVDDICDIQSLPFNSFDGIICNAVLEHVYEPGMAVANLHRLLIQGGHLIFYAPFLYAYHAPLDLKYQDYYRYTRDGLAYLFREFSEVTIYPVRGRLSTLLNLLPFWKIPVEKYLGQWVNKVVDLPFQSRRAPLQASGYYVWARK